MHITEYISRMQAQNIVQKTMLQEVVLILKGKSRVCLCVRTHECMYMCWKVYMNI